MAFICTPFVVLLLVLLTGKDEEELDRRAIESGQKKICPSCGETVMGKAKVCRFCGVSFNVQQGAAELPNMQTPPGSSERATARAIPGERFENSDQVFDDPEQS